MLKVSLFKRLSVLAFSAFFIGTSSVSGLSVNSEAKAANADPNNQATALKLVNKVTHSDDGTGYVYADSSLKVTFLVPPKDFNPTTASDAKLAEYGFPARPKGDVKSLASWNKVMSSYTGSEVPQINEVIYKSDESTQTPTTFSSTPTETAGWGNWGGWTDYNSSSTWCGAQGQFVQPTNKNISASFTQYSTNNTNPISIKNEECSWIGLGGEGNVPLSQAGTWMNYGSDTYDGFFECLDPSGDNDEHVFNLSNSSLQINPGNSIYLYISYQSSNNLFNYYIHNNDTGKSVSALITPVDNNSGKQFDSYYGNSVEWIDETPCLTYSNGSSYFAPLSNFGSITWTDCEAYTNTQKWEPINAGPNYGYYTMQNGHTNHTLSSIGSLTSNGEGFTDTWQNYQ